MRVQLLNIAVDFDGVISKFEGWQGEFTFGEPVEGSIVLLSELSKTYRVVIHTARPDIAEVWKWLNKYAMSQYVDEVTNFKPPAVAYIDDRAICFSGDVAITLKAVKAFSPYWDK